MNTTQVIDYSTLVIILCHLPQNVLEYFSVDILSCSLVSKLWRKVCLNEFVWTTIYKAVLAGGMPREERFITANLIDLVPKNSYYTVVSDKRTIANQIAWSLFQHQNKETLQTYIDFLHSDELANSKGLWRNYVVFNVTNNFARMNVVCQINTASLSKLIQSGSSFKGSFLRRCIDFLYDTSALSLGHPTSQLAYKLEPIVQPEGFVKGFVLSSYQLRTLNWLLDVEKSAKERHYYEGIVTWRTDHGYLYFDTTKASFVSPSDLHAYHKIDFSVKGGVLVNDAQLGKKVEIISLILATLHYARPLEENKGFISTRATLIICSDRRTAERWKKEVLKITNPPLKVMGFEDLAHITGGSSINADVVITSPEQIRNQENSFLKSLTGFMWNRVVLVHSHLILKDPTFDGILSQVVGSLNALHWWCVSCTPFSTQEVLQRTMKILGFPYPHCTRQLVTRYVLTNTHQHVIVDCNPNVIREEYPVDLNGVELYFYILALSNENRYKVPNVIYPLDETKRSLVPSAKNAVILCVDEIKKGYTPTPNLFLNLWSYASIANAPDIYQGPATTIAEVLQNVSDTALSQEIAEKGDLLEESDIFKMAMEGSDPPVTNTLLEKKGPPSLSSTTGTKASQPARIQKPSFLKMFSLKSPKSDVTEQRRYDQSITKEDGLHFLTNICGTRIAHMLCYLQSLWERDPSARVLIYSNMYIQKQIYDVMQEAGIATGVIANRYAARRVAVAERTTDEHPFRVLLTCYQLRGTVALAISHVFFFDFLSLDATNKMISSCYAQGKREAVVVVNYFWKDSNDHVNLRYAGMTTGGDGNNLVYKLQPISSKSEIGALVVNSKIKLDVRMSRLISFDK